MTPTQYRQAGEHAMEQLGAAGVCTPFEGEHFRKDGACVPVLIGLARLEESADSAICFTLDISDRKRTERVRSATYRISELANSAQNLEQFFSPTHEAVKELMPAKNLYIALHDEAASILSFSYYVDEVDQAPPPFLRRGDSRSTCCEPGCPCSPIRRYLMNW
jgi:hypothetical protein